MIPSKPFFRAALLATATAALAPLFAGAQQLNAPVSKNAQAAAPEQPFHGEVVEDIIARVNDQVISTSDYNRALSDLDQQAKQRNLSPADVDEQKRQLLRDLVDNQLLLSKGKQLGITGEAETIRQLDELRKQNNLDSLEALEKAAEQQGVSFADFKASIQNRAITTQVIRDEVGRRINITQTDEHAYYDAHKEQFTTPETVKLAEILIPTADPDNAAQVAEAQKKADELHAQLENGAAFAALAKANSTGATAAEGGALGDFKRGQLAGVLEDAVWPLPAGGYTAPIRTKQGFVILKSDGHTPAGVQPFEQVQAQVEDAVGSAKVQPALRAYLTRLREEAYIDIKPGFVDSAASKTETHPIFSAYTPPQPKKKKPAVGRTRFQGSARDRSVAAKQAAKNPPTTTVVPAGVPSLADVPGGTNGTATAPATAANSAPPPSATAANSAPPPPAAAKGLFGRKPKEIASAPKPQKREKVRFGQAPRESLPAGQTKGEDAGASAENGNASAGEKDAQSASTQGSVNSNIRFANGESASDEQAAAAAKKTRFSDRALIPKAVKEDQKRKAKQDPFPTAPPDAQEIADKQSQAKPLGLGGDTSKPVPKPKPTEKTRFSDEAGKKKLPADETTPAPAEPAPATPAQAPPGTDSAAPAGSPPPQR